MRAIERRSYLRITDEASVEDLAVSDEQARQNTAENLLDVDQAFSFRKHLYKLELEARELQREISSIDRPLGSFLHNMNKRMEFLTEVVMGPKSELAGNVIDIGPGGVSYLSQTPFPANDMVALKLTFSNESLGFACFGRISHSLLAEDDQYRIGVQFVSAEPAIEALINRHIAARQAEERRKRLRNV